MSLPDGRPTALVQRPGMDNRPAFSPDGQRVAFLSNNGRPSGATDNVSVCVIPAAGGAITDLIADESQVQSFTVTGNGTVFMTGTTAGTGQPFARRLSPSGSLKNVLFGVDGGGFRLFPDGPTFSLWRILSVLIGRYLPLLEIPEPDWPRPLPWLLG